MVAPVGLVAPAGALFAAGWQYLDVVRDKRRLARSLGLFVPPHVVEQLVRKPGAFESTRESLDCSCLVTDAADYTTLSETLQSEQLAALLNQYFEALFRPVLDLGGYVSDVIGDSMLALWPDRGSGRQGRLRVCEACLDAVEAVERFNRISPIAKLPTRFGVHFGPVTLGMVGALTHYEYRAVGDTVNTANRVQGLNKRLGTRVLASEAAVEGLERAAIARPGPVPAQGKAHAYAHLRDRLPAPGRNPKRPAPVPGVRRRARGVARRRTASWPARGSTGWSTISPTMARRPSMPACCARGMPADGSDRCVKQRSNPIRTAGVIPASHISTNGLYP